MAKSIWYSKPLARQWDIYLKNYARYKESPEIFFNRMIQKFGYNPFAPWQKSQLNIYLWDLWYSDATKKLMHIYFTDKSLKEFLENIPLADLAGIGKYIDENGFITEQGFLKLKYFPFGIHIPYENKYKAFAFGLMNNQFNQMVLSWAEENGGAWCSEKNYTELLQQNTKDAKEITKIFRLAINTIAYMEAFPECIKEGVPNHIKEFDDENSFTLEIAEKVLESINRTNDGRIISPHFRRGYYKRLSSNFYKNKKGQIVFVSETMVNGIAKTVEKSKDDNKLENFKKESKHQ